MQFEFGRFKGRLSRRTAAKPLWKALSLAAALAQAACASATNYDGAIAGFSMANDAAAQALQKLDTTTTNELNALAIAEAMKRPLNVERLSNMDCVTGSTTRRCVLIVRPNADQPDPLQLGRTSSLSNSLQIMSGIQKYATALDAMASADASADVRAGADKAIGAAASLATVVGIPQAAVLAGARQPLVDFTVFAFGQYQNAVKLRALRDATNAADPVIAQAMTLLGKEAEFGRTALLADLAADYDAAFRVVQGAAMPTEARVTALISAAAEFNKGLTSNPTESFGKVAMTHAALAAALRSSRPSFAEVLMLLDGLVDQFNNIQEIANTVAARRQ